MSRPSKAIVPAVKKAREKGVLVIALDSPTDPIDATDALFATDNYKAGVLIGQYAKAALGDKKPVIATLDLFPGHPVGAQRHNGFMKGFGIDIKDPTDIGDEDDPRISGHDVTSGNEEGGRKAMENLLQKDPTINVVYTINEPAAAGASTHPAPACARACAPTHLRTGALTAYALTYLRTHAPECPCLTSFSSSSRTWASASSWCWPG